MGGMVATIVAGKYPDRVQSVVINCAAAKLGFSGRLVFKNWIDLIKLEGCGSRILAELIAWQCLSRGYMATPEGQAGVDVIQQILRDANEDRVMIEACEAMNAMDNRDWVRKITSPALVIGGDEDVMTPWDQGPDGAGQQWIADNLPNGGTYVVKGGNHSTIFDWTADHAQAVSAFFPSTRARPTAPACRPPALRRDCGGTPAPSSSPARISWKKAVTTARPRPGSRGGRRDRCPGTRAGAPTAARARRSVRAEAGRREPRRGHDVRAAVRQQDGRRIPSMSGSRSIVSIARQA